MQYTEQMKLIQEAKDPSMRGGSADGEANHVGVRDEDMLLEPDGGGWDGWSRPPASRGGVLGRR